MTKDVKSLESRIQEHYEAMPPAERRLGDLLLGFPGDAANYSATELADMAGTSKAAATRFFRRLGYKDFNEARREIRSARRWGSPLYLNHGGAETENKSQTIQAHLEREMANLSRTLEALRPDTLDAAARAISGAQRIFVLGYRNSRVLANYLQRQLTLLRPNVWLLPVPGDTLGEDLVDIGPDDVLILIGMRRRVAQIPTVMKIANRAQTPILLITDPSATRTAKLATWTLICQVRGTSIFDSYTGVVSTLNLLCTAIFRQATKTGYARLRRIEDLHEELDELDSYGRFDGSGAD